MTKLIVLALFLCFAAQCQSQGFDIWRRWGGPYTTNAPTQPPATTKKPRPPVRTTKKPRPTTRAPPTTEPPSNDDRCKYKEGKCIPNNGGNAYRILTSRVAGCPDKRKDCEDAELMAQLLTDSFITPSAIQKPGVAAAQRPTDVGGRTTNIGGTGTAQKQKPKPAKKNCLVIKNAQGRVITGGCTDENEYLVPSRSKRSVPVPVIETKRDVLIVMDESGSVGVKNYRKVKRIAAAIVKLLCGNIRYDKDFTRIAVISFDEYYHFHVPLNKFYNNPDALATFIKNKIRYHSYSSGRTCMAKALKFGYQVMLSKALGARLNQYDVEQDIILITDGCANCDRSHGSIAQTIDYLSEEIKARNIKTYVIGIGLERSHDNCKEILQTLAQGGRCFHFFYLDRWDYDVDIFLKQLEFPPNNVCLNTFEHPLGQCLPPISP